MPDQCPKCKSHMEEGFLLEKGNYNALSAEVWVSGRPDEKSFFGMSVKDKAVRQVCAFRCIACGYLESYAK